jgi:hypothetical protein
LDAEKTQEKSGKRKIREMEMVVSRMPRFAKKQTDDKKKKVSPYEKDG